ncbi:MAG: WecB/TagA/CpsF family glycosyltransferase [Clostridia bacterium]|nr:WecB/TagA/CpsF family glycosyltransferase [Clostridia bacterium]
MPEKIDIHGVMIDNVTMDEALERVIQMLGEPRPHAIYTPNAEIIMQSTRDAELKDILNAADLVVPDGAGVILASKILNRRLKQKVSGVDLTKRIFMNTDKRATSFFIFGGKPGVAEMASVNILSEFPRANIVGFRNGYFKEEDIPEIIKQINASRAEIVLVALGAPKQEKWIHQHAGELNCKVLMGVGGSIDIFAGTAPMAPEFMRKSGFEWLYRLIKQPSRYKRMMDLPRFMMLTYKTKFKKGK